MRGPDELAARVLRNVSATGLWDFIRRRLENAAAPPLPVALSPPLRAITTVRDLVETGRRFGNCLGKEPRHMLDLVTGRRSFFILDDEQPLVAEVEIFDSQLFVVLRTEAPYRAEVRWQGRVAIVRALERSGLHTTPPGLLDSLEALEEWPPDDRERHQLNIPVGREPRTEHTEAK